MEKVLRSTLLEYEKSTFIIELVKHKKENSYISIEQIIRSEEQGDRTHKIRINPTILADIIEALSDFQVELPETITQEKKYFSKKRKDEIIKRYLKGISIRELVLQFDCEKEIIIQILHNNGIEIVNNELHSKKQKKYYRGKQF